VTALCVPPDFGAVLHATDKVNELAAGKTCEEVFGLKAAVRQQKGAR